MTCYRSRDNWHSYVKNSLNKADLESMASHLTNCTECQYIVTTIQETAAIIAKSRITLRPPAAIKLNVMMAIDKNRYKKVSSSHLVELKKWGISLVAGGMLLLALNLTSSAPNFQSGQVVELNSQIGKQIAHPFEKISQAANAAMVKLETIRLTPHE